MSRRLYSLLLYLMLPWALLHLVWRARKQPAYLAHIGERFAMHEGGVEGPVIWIHAVSVGETRAAEPLVKALQARHPGTRILMTHGTPTGRQTSVELYGDSVERCYLPYDFNWAALKFLRRNRPVAGIFMETEIWPNFIHSAHRAGIALFLVNARMSEKSARGYRRIGGLTREALTKLAGVGAQTDRDARRLADLGATNVAVTGNIKFDRAAPAEMIALGAKLRESFGPSRPVFLAASTRAGEEAIVLDAIDGPGIPADLLTIIVPRHPQRFDEVAGLATRRGFRTGRRSDGKPIDAATRVVIGDSMGELFAYYAACDFTFVGGSLLPLGGQNLLEACAVGRAVIVGPHTFNFEEATEGAVMAGAAVRVDDTEALREAIIRMTSDSGMRRSMGEAGLNFMLAHAGATQRTLRLLRW